MKAKSKNVIREFVRGEENKNSSAGVQEKFFRRVGVGGQVSGHHSQRRLGGRFHKKGWE